MASHSFIYIFIKMENSAILKALDEQTVASSDEEWRHDISSNGGAVTEFKTEDLKVHLAQIFADSIRVGALLVC